MTKQIANGISLTEVGRENSSVSGPPELKLPVGGGGEYWKNVMRIVNKIPEAEVRSLFLVANEREGFMRTKGSKNAPPSSRKLLVFAQAEENAAQYTLVALREDGTGYAIDTVNYVDLITGTAHLKPAVEWVHRKHNFRLAPSDNELMMYVNAASSLVPPIALAD